MKIENLLDHSTLLTQNQMSSKEPFNPSILNDMFPIPPEALTSQLRNRGCNGCDLGQQKGLVAPVVFRGKITPGRIIIGEAPGLGEDAEGKPFVGPAGKLLDKIFLSVKWDTNKDWFLTNTVYCRPIAPPGSCKQNLTPTASHRAACRPYLENMLDYRGWHIAVLLGKVAAISLFPELLNEPMYKLVGRIFHSKIWPNTNFYIMYHPAALLHAQKTPNKYEEMKQVTKNNIATLRELVDEWESQ